MLSWKNFKVFYYVLKFRISIRLIFFRLLKMKRTLRHEQEKKTFHFDSEAERENAIKEKLVSNNMAWLFMDTELILLTPNITKWPEKLKQSQKFSMIEGQSYYSRRKHIPVGFKQKGA